MRGRTLWLGGVLLVLYRGGCSSSLPSLPSQPRSRRLSETPSPSGEPSHPQGYHGWIGQAAKEAGVDRETARLARRITRGQISPTPFDREDESGMSSISGFKPSALQLVGRALYLLYIFSPMFITALLAFLMRGFRSPYWYRTIASAIASSGAAFIKWGQWASTRPDMFPDELCTTLAMLHSAAPVHSFDYTRREVEKALGGKKLEEAFDYFESQPIASGSIAQVHKAGLHGRDIAVKVRHPGVAEEIEIDFRLMRFIADLFDRIPALKFLHLRHSMDQFSHTLASQTRLDVEGAHLLLLNRNFKRWKNVRFPEPLFLSEAVLIETFEEGTIISDYIARYGAWKEEQRSLEDRLGRRWLGGFAHLHDYFRDGITQVFDDVIAGVTDVLLGSAGDEASSSSSSSQALATVSPLSYEIANFIVATGSNLYLKMLLVDNLMHADLHPGNILIHTGRGPPRLILVDAGMVAKLTVDERENFIGLLEALGDGNARRAARHVLGFSKTQTCQGETAAAFTDAMEACLRVKCRGYNTNVDVGDVLRSVLQLVREFQVRVDVNYATLLINLLCVEGLAGALDEDFNVLDRAKLLLKPHSKRLVRPFFRLLFPALLTIKGFHDAFVFRLVKMTKKRLRAPPPPPSPQRPALPPGGQGA